MSGKTEIAAPAKLNLYLKVLERLPNGYHRIESLFMPLTGLCDRVEVEFDAPPGVGLVCPEGAPADGSNLAFRAAALYAETAGIAPAWRITLTKSIPAAAGMGGGSSDAAAVLRILNAEHRALSQAELESVALQLGADVPFFLAPAWAVVGGVGNELSPVPNPPEDVHAVILKPPFPISAKWAYTHLDPALFGGEPGRVEELLEALRQGDVERAGYLMKNDLSRAILRKFPVYDEVEKAVRELAGRTPMITGSGSACFTLAGSAEEGEALRDALARRFENWRVMAV